MDIRSASGSLFAIVDEETGGLLGTVDEARAFYHVHPGAVYLHQGEQFEVSELDLAGKVALVKRADPDYYTQARDLTDIEVLDEIEVDEAGPADAVFGEVRVTRRVVGFTRKSVYSNEVMDEVDLFLPDQTLETKALWWLIPSDLLERARVSRAAVPGSLHAAEHAAIGMLPLIATCDRWDVGGVSTALHADTGMATIFVYDGYPGGAGIVESGFRSRIAPARGDVRGRAPVSLRAGCPSCVQSPKCGNGNEPLDKQGAVALLAVMLGPDLGLSGWPAPTSTSPSAARIRRRKTLRRSANRWAAAWPAPAPSWCAAGWAARWRPRRAAPRRRAAPCSASSPAPTAGAPTTSSPWPCPPAWARCATRWWCARPTR